MTTRKPKAATKAPTPASEEKAKLYAKTALLPSANAAAVVEAYGKTFGEQDIGALVDELRNKFEQVKAGDLSHCENMLVGQAQALQSIFVSLARRAVNQDYLKQYETYLRLALKAQNQSRMTLETLATLKNPPVVFAKQANIAHGHQQVNNGVSQNEPHDAHAGKTINQPNELLEVQHGGKTLDSATTQTAIPQNPAMAAVG